MKNKYKSTLAACYIGYITQAITINLAPLFFAVFQKDYSISYAELANLVLITFLIQMAVDAIMTKLTYRIGYRKLAVFSHVFASFGLILLGILPRIIEPYTGIVIASVFYSIGGGLTEVIISPIVDSLPSDAKASGMCLLHSFYSWGLLLCVVITTAMLKLLGNECWYIVAIAWSIVPLFNTFFFLKVPLPEILPEVGEIPMRYYFRQPLMYVAIILMVCGGASEQAMSQWASLFAEKGLGVSKMLGDLLGPCLFAVNMGIGRTLYGIFGHKINMTKALLSCGVLTFLCYILTAFAGLPIFSLFGCAVCGLGVSLMWPGVLSLTSTVFGNKSSPAMFALLAFSGDIGCSLGPWVTGIVSDLCEGTGLYTSGEAMKTGILASSAFPVIMIAFIIVMAKMNKQKESV